MIWYVIAGMCSLAVLGAAALIGELLALLDEAGEREVCLVQPGEPWAPYGSRASASIPRGAGQRKVHAPSVDEALARLVLAVTGRAVARD